MSAVMSGTVNRNAFSELSLNTTEPTLPFYLLSPIALAPKELAFIDFDGLFRTAEFLRVSQYIVQHHPPTEFASINNGYRTI